MNGDTVLLKEIREDVRGIFKMLHGDGDSPGLKGQVALNTRDIKTIISRYKYIIGTVTAVVITVIGGIILGIFHKG